MSDSRESITARVARLERVVGSLLTLLAAREIIGPEDFGQVREALTSRTEKEEPDAKVLLRGPSG